MASIVRRHPAAHAHAHFRRVKPSTKPETTLAQATGIGGKGMTAGAGYSFTNINKIYGFSN